MHEQHQGRSSSMESIKYQLSSRYENNRILNHILFKIPQHDFSKQLNDFSFIRKSTPTKFSLSKTRSRYTIVVETLFFSEPRFSAAELGLPDDVPTVLLVGFPLDKDRCHITNCISEDSSS